MAQSASRKKAADIVPPLAVGVLMLIAWETFCRALAIPPYLFPMPSVIAKTLVADAPALLHALWVTLRVTLIALALAVTIGATIAFLFVQSPIIERSFFPYAIILQVTPIVAIAPLIIIWVRNIPAALLICAWLVAFFPIVSNTTLGLNSADHNLLNLMQLYGASRRQIFWYLRLPSALPYFLGGLRISGGLALIGAVVAEFVAGTGGAQSGLAYRILESGYTMQIPRMFAALLMITGSGIFIFLALTALSHLALRKWHESAVQREG
jgi:NitT/TauT family transport system permease protein